MTSALLLRPVLGLFLLLSPLAEAAAEAAGWARVCALFNASGVLSGIDGPGQYGAELAALEAENVELVSFDALSDLGRAVELATRCVEAHEATVGVGFGDSRFVQATAPIFQRAGRAFVSITAADPSLPASVGPGLFLVDFTLDAEAEALARFARHELEIERLAIWTNGSTAATQSLGALFRRAFEAAGGTVAGAHRYVSEQQDFITPAVALAKQLETAPGSIQGVFVAALPAEAIPAVTALRQVGITLPILGGEGFDGGNWSSADSTLIGDVYFAAADSRGHQGPLVEHFLESYQLHFGAPPTSGSAALAYDALRLIDDAAARATSKDPAGLLKALASTHAFEGVTGRIGYADGRRVPGKPVAILRVEQGSGTPVWTWSPLR